MVNPDHIFCVLCFQDNDLFSGVLQERASVMFAKAGMHRKMAFHYILAGHRFYKAGQSALSIECYKRALPQYANKHWQYAEVIDFKVFFFVILVGI